MRKSFLCCLLLLAASTARQHAVVFDEPIDALSVGFASSDASVDVKIGDTWETLAIEDEADPRLRESNLVVFPAPTTEIVLRGDWNAAELHPIRVSKEPVSYALAADTFYRAPKILRRADWGADNSFLFEGPQLTQAAEPVQTDNGGGGSAGAATSNREQDCMLAQKQYPQEFRAGRTVDKDAEGREFRWTQSYSPAVKLLVVHHTALKVTGDSRPGAERVRALYEYHANNRGWGDVGYHYLIDEAGVIYEGRAGGDYVVGGHVYCGNVGTVGIALLGNFEEEKPTLVQIQSLQWMLDSLAKKYGIDPARSVMFHGKSVPSILRHKDLISTECPGYFLSNVITQVRTNVVKGDLLAGVKFPTVVAKKPAKNAVEERLSSRLANAGEALSRRYFRAKRLVRTAGRQETDPRLTSMEKQLQESTNLQSQRAAKEARRNRIAATARTSSEEGSNIRIRLTHAGNVATIAGATSVNGSPVTGDVRLGRDGTLCSAVTDGGTVSATTLVMAGDILTVSSKSAPFNRYAGTIECRIIGDTLVLINELPLEEYIAGLAEEPDTEPFEKQKAFAIAARSYAAHYTDAANRKFPGMPYDGDDSPARFQAYGGVTFAQRNPLWTQAVGETAFQVIMKNGTVVKTPYFSSDDGRTRTPADNGWKDFPFAEVFTSKPDPWCQGLPLAGHGVGMSGCGAEGQANEGKTFEEILRYYYPGTEINKL